MGNPGSAVLTESKRFPLVWDRLSTELPTWRRLLPATVDVRDADWVPRRWVASQIGAVQYGRHGRDSRADAGARMEAREAHGSVAAGEVDRAAAI